MVIFDYNYGGGGTNIGSKYSGGGSSAFGTFTFKQHSSSTSQIPLFISNTGNVGVNEQSPDRNFHVTSGTSNVVAKFESTDSHAVVEFTDNAGSAEIGCIGDDVAFFPAGVEKMRVDSSGKVIIIDQAIGFRKNWATSEAWSVSTQTQQTGYYGGDFTLHGDGNAIAHGIGPDARQLISLDRY